MKRMGLLSITLVAALAVACGGNNDRDDIGANNTIGNPDADAVGTAGDNQLSAGDRNFIEESAASGMAEIELGRLAAERGQSADVRRFGQMMVDAHMKADAELKQVASRYNFTPPPALEEEHRELRDRLSRLQGAEFDREYMEAMVDSHQNVVDHLESRVDRHGGAAASIDRAREHDSPNREQSNTQPPMGAPTVSPQRSDNAATTAVNQWAAKTLPAAEQHLEEARRLNERLEGRRDRTN